jgi:4-amino-4-deoxy-L-arabinose transferase-like glycosyltransferase
MDVMDVRLKRRDWARLLPLLCIYLLLAISYGLVTPIYEGPDEIGHVLYTKHIAEGLGIPVQNRDYAISYGFGQEGSQAPLYYALNAALLRITGLSLADVEGIPDSNPFTTCGQPGAHNVARYQHDPQQETFPYVGSARSVHVMRLVSALLGAITVAAIYTTARLAFPGRDLVAVLAAGLVGLNPQFAFMGGVVNNDNLVNCLVALVLALTMYGYRRRFTWRLVIALGIFSGLAPLAKLGGLVASVFVALAMIAKWRREPRKLLARGLVCAAVFLAVAGWWLVRNEMLYGDPTGTNAMLSVYGGRGGWPRHLILAEIANTFRSYWASFACELRFPRAIYWVLAALNGAAIAGWALKRTAVRREERTAAVLLLIWLGVVTGLWVRWNQITYAPLGRLFFQANGAIAPLLAYGLIALTPRPRWMATGVAAGLGTLSLLGVLLIERPAFAPPPRYEVDRAPAPTTRVSDAHWDQRVDILGFDLAPTSLEPNGSLEVRLHLRARHAPDERLSLALQLISPVAGDDSTLVNFNTLPGEGIYPVTAWQPDEVIVGHYRLQIPEQVARAQAWQVVAILYRLQDGERLPLFIEGQHSGEAWQLGLVRVGASRVPDLPASAELDTKTIYGESIRLEGILLNAEEETIRVQAWWQATRPMTTDYTGLVHLYDDAGNLLATADSPPLVGAFPTSMWEAGDWVVEEYALPRTDGSSVGLGWYNPEDGVRLPVTEADAPGILLFAIPGSGEAVQAPGASP